MTSREHVLAALYHRETDRIPIAMVCGGINPPAMRALNDYLKMDRGMDAASYINTFLDVGGIYQTLPCQDQRDDPSNGSQGHLS